MQLEALEALIEHMEPARPQPLSRRVFALVQHVVTREGGSAFTRDSITEACRVAAAKAAAAGGPGPPGAAAEQPPGPASPLREEASPRRVPAVSCEAGSVTGAAVGPAGAGRRGSSSSVTEGHSWAVLQVLRTLVTSCDLAFSDVAGQILWRFRRSEPLQDARYVQAAESARWLLPDAVEMVDAVFRQCTESEGCRMRRSHWQKVAHLIMKNPVLRGRVHHGNLDRVFYSMTMRRADRAVGLGDFKRMLLQLAETSQVHPWMIFNAVACHDGHIALDPVRV